MFDLLHKHPRVTQAVLALITLPFAFFGVDYYFRGGDSGQTVASVGKNKITQAEFDDALRDQQQRMRQALGSNFDPAMLDSPEMRYALLDQLVNQRLLENEARAGRFRVTDAQLAQFIAALPPFQEDGKFSADRYREVLASQNMSPLMFEQRVRGDLVLSPLQDPIIGGSIAAKSSVQRYLTLLDQKRDVAIAQVAAEPFEKSVKVSDDDVKAFYDKNPKAFATPEVAKVDYILLTQDAMAAQVKVDPAEVKQAYEANAKQYTTSEERQASHILIAVKKDASDADKAKAKQKAAELAEKARAKPDSFAELAKANSQDPGSAAQGGDLGSFARGAMVKPFEDAVFAAKVGDIVGPVQTDFGYHVIKVTGITPPHVQSFDEVKGRIEAELKRQKAAQKFASAADQFQNLVYEQADSLAGAAKTLDLKVETTPLVTREKMQSIAMGSAKFVQALFSPESVQSKRNTEAIEVGPNALMAGRIVEYKPAAPKPFAEVRDEIRQQLIHQRASELAVKTGREKLALLEAGKDAGVAFDKPVTLTRNQAQPGVTADGLKKIFDAGERKLPEYAGASNERGGFSIYRIDKVIDPPAPDAAKVDAASARVGSELGRELMNAYLASLKADTDVKINQAALEKKQNQ
ncbi:MAG TPA: SurA N-terminal domain-containing protein [Casimicrobiaceae bacterium]|nr:SurA N-terminal domain-containing protein [Casimicrobiaceae bacterium]